MGPIPLGWTFLHAAGCEVVGSADLSPSGVGGSHNYAAREPGLVVLVSRGGKVLRGWPSGVTRVELASRLEELVER
jgi:hypothetical protein